MKKLIILIMFFMSGVHAEELVIHLGSYHSAYRSELRQVNALNEFNPGIGWQNDKWSAGIYKNSLSKGVVYGARRWAHDNYFVFAGLANADTASAPIVPFVGVGVDLGSIQLIAFPSVTYLPDSPDKNGKPFVIFAVSAKVGI